MVALSPSYPLRPSDLGVDEAALAGSSSATLFPSIRRTKPSSSPRSSGSGMGQSSEFVPTDVGARVTAFLRRRHPFKTAARVAGDTGCGVDAVEKWLERASTPSGAAMLRLFLAYGPDFICAVVDEPPAWLDARRVALRQAELETSIARQRDELAQLQGRRP